MATATPSVTLPPRPNVGDLRSFWIALTLLGGTVAGGAVLWTTGAEPSVAATGAYLGLVALVVVGGVFRPVVARGAYRLWNRLARRYARAATAVVAAICLYTVVWAARWGGRSLRLDRPEPGSGTWHRRETLPADQYGGMGRSARGDGSAEGLAGTLGWSLRSRNWWWLALAPFLFLLRALGERGEDRPRDVYTLY